MQQEQQQLLVLLQHLVLLLLGFLPVRFVKVVLPLKVAVKEEVITLPRQSC
jgi:hypothetical protein